MGNTKKPFMRWNRYKLFVYGSTLRNIQDLYIIRHTKQYTETSNLTWATVRLEVKTSYLYGRYLKEHTSISHMMTSFNTLQYQKRDG